jgi:uncharacterized protein with HEPN domain
MTDTLDRVQHIQEAIVKIMKYTKRGRSQFDREEETLNSIIYYLQILGEAARIQRLPSRDTLEANDKHAKQAYSSLRRN